MGKLTEAEPKVTIITPTLNRARTLPRLYASLAGQTFVDWEWLIVDGGSTDGSAALVGSWDDRRIRFIVEPGHANDARNLGERRAVGAYILHIDSDDELFSPQTLASMVEDLLASDRRVGLVSYTVVTSGGSRALSRVEGGEVRLGYADCICENRVKGEFISLYRQEAARTAEWPSSPGLECRRHWEILRSWDAMVYARVGRIYHLDTGDNLVGVDATLRRAAQMAEGAEQLIEAHAAMWTQACPDRLAHHFYLASAYHALAGRTAPSWRRGVDALRARHPVVPVSLVLATLLLPLPARRALFRWRWRRRSAGSDLE